MRKIVASLACSVAMLVIAALALRGAARGYGPAQPLDVVDTGGNPAHALAITEARQAVYGAPYLRRTNARKVIAIGASVVREGFRPEDWRARLPGIEFHNLAIGAATPDVILRLWPHIDAAVPRSVAERSLVVLGVVYGMLNTTSPDLVAEEQAHMGPFWPLVRRMGPNAIRTVTREMVPLLAIDKAIRNELTVVTPAIDRKIHGSAPTPEEIHFTPDQALANWDGVFEHAGVVRADRMESLSTLIETIRSSGFSLAVVNMPLPAWHRARSDYDHQFQQMLLPLMARKTAADSRITFIDLHDRFPDDSFGDSMHPTRAGAAAWSTAVIDTLERRGVLKQ